MNACKRTNAHYVFSELIVKSRKTASEFAEQQKILKAGERAFNKMMLRHWSAIVPGSFEVKGGNK